MPAFLAAVPLLWGGAAAGAAGSAAALSPIGAALGAGAAGSVAGTAATTAAVTGAAGAIGSSVLGAGTSALLAPKLPRINLPNAPGAAQTDPAASQAAARQRQQQAIAGGFGSTVLAGSQTGTSAGYTAATAGGRTLLGA